MRKAMKDFLDLEVYDTAHDEFRMQPCHSPIWDSAISGVRAGGVGHRGGPSAVAKGGRVDPVEGSEGFPRRLEAQEPDADHERVGL